MIDALKILAMMIALQAPGRSVYSRMPAQHEGLPCSDATILCAPPRYDDGSGWTVAEDESTGRERYAVIAEALEVETWRIPPSRRERIRRLAVVVMYHESGYREDVHAGRTRGDEGRSWCLGQILLGRDSERGALLVGTNPLATRRCVRTIVDILDRAHRWCRGNVVCILAQYGGASPANPAVLKRAGTYHRQGHMQ